ncbi:MAG: pbuG [Anaeromyxobacteraceae bacterium]|nr:pbuG [Anaeromyxobacteraceae bacterium]
MRWFVRGDVDGFFGLALDNLVQLLVIDALCRHALGFPADLVRGTILPGAAVSVLAGNLYYAWQAMRLARRTGRTDVTALPFGINTVSLFAFVFLVMLPAKLAAQAAGAADPARVAWQAGLVACLGSGLVELAGALLAERIRRATPRAALLSTLAGIALGFISLGFLLRAFSRPVVGFATLGIVLLTYFGQVRFRGRLPGGLVAVVLGTFLAWATGIAPVGAAPATAATWSPPVPVLGALWEALSGGHLGTYLSVILPMGLFTLVGSLQNVESAEAAGDAYPTLPSLTVNGLSTVVAACLGSCFPTTLYIGHPGWKALGARAGYSILNGIFVAVVALSGTLSWIAWAVPVDAGLAIVVWIGIVISAQAFQVVPRAHAPAVVMGLLPGIASWGVLMAKSGLRAAGVGAPGGPPLTEGVVDAFQRSDVWMRGGFALDQGFIFTAMILSAGTVMIIERRFRAAAGWFAVGAALSAAGLMHAWRLTPQDAVMDLRPAWPFVAGYAFVAAVLLLAPLVTVPEDGAEG